MKDTYTSMETVTTCCGNTVIFVHSQVMKFFKETFEKNYSNFTTEEKEEFFHIDNEYGDLLAKIWKEPLQDMLKTSYGADWALPHEERNPTQEYEYVLANRDNDLTDEQYNLKLERLRQHKEWFESQ